MIEIEIDGKKLPAKPGQMIIEVADAAGITIPRFCYHQKLTVAANCRMCLVEVEKAPKTVPACATPVAPGMKVFTTSEKTVFSQRAVMEFLLINHPLDCPICDQGGECELQDLSLGFGKGFSRFEQKKRAVKDQDLGPLIATEMTRCIYCTRCVRFGTEIAGMRELGGIGRGEHTEISTYVEHLMKSELSGNIIDLCPVGALTSKPFRFTARTWEMQQLPFVALHDCLGSNIDVHTRGEEYSQYRHVMRVVPRVNETINETWISDRDRFSYEAHHSVNRISLPLIRRNGQLEEVNWETALSVVADHLSKIIKTQGANAIGALISPSATLEEMYLLQKLMRGLECNNIDHRIRQNDFRHEHQFPVFPTVGLPIAEIEQLDALLLIGSDIRREQPVANNRVRKIAQRCGEVMCINPVDYDYNYSFSEKIIAHGDEFIQSLAKVAKALLENSPQNSSGDLENLLASMQPGVVEKAIAEKLQKHGKTAILLGAYAINHPKASVVHALVQLIATLSDTKWGYLTEGANASGAWLSGAIPHRSTAGVHVAQPGLNAKAMFAKPLKSYLLFNVEPELDCTDSANAVNALELADFVVVFSPFRTPMQEQYADVILPIALFAENSGTFINADGQWQTVDAVTIPWGEVRPAWKVLRVLANMLKVDGFDYVNHLQILNEIKTQVSVMQPQPETAWQCPESLELDQQKIIRFAQWPMYRVDNIVRQATALQATIEKDTAAIRINAILAGELKLNQGERIKASQNGREVILPLIIDDRIANQQVFIPAGINETAGFGCAFGEIDLEKVS